jgi:hypothetical protein
MTTSKRIMKGKQMKKITRKTTRARYSNGKIAGPFVGSAGTMVWWEELPEAYRELIRSRVVITEGGAE